MSQCNNRSFLLIATAVLLSLLAAAQIWRSPRQALTLESKTKPIDSAKSISPAEQSLATATNDTPSAAYDCLFTEGPFAIDGVADEEAWKFAKQVDNLTMPWLRANDDKLLTATHTKLLWDREYLYFFTDMVDADLYADIKEHDGETWNNDAVEMLFKPATDKPGYYVFQVTPANTTLDMFIPRRQTGGYQRYRAEGEFDCKTAVHLDGTLNTWSDTDKGWSCEGRLAWKDLARTGGRPDEGELWKFAICRYDYSVDFEGPVVSTNAPLKSPTAVDAHLFENYTPVKFIGPNESPRQEAAKPFGIEKFVKLTTSHVQGSPDPPHPYTVERLFEKLPIECPVTIAKQPNSDLVWIVTQSLPFKPTTLSRFKNVNDAATLEKLVPADIDCMMYDISFHPQFAENGYVFIGSNGSFGGAKRSRVTRYHVDPRPPYKFDRDSATIIIEWESDGHNGAALDFGPDGMLYITSGDGTSDSDENLRGQDLTHLTCKLLRIDVDHPEPGKTYRVPSDNPFVDEKDCRPETYAYGLRNPWRMDIDQKSGRIWVGNNGQDLWEQIYLVDRGANYGWSIVEGGHDFYPDRKRGPQPISKPIADHSHREARSLTGGIVYYGDKLRDLDRAYLYGDYATGKIWAMKHDGERITLHQEIADTTMQITAFADGNEGDVWILDLGGKSISRLIPQPNDKPLPVFPVKLSESGLFKNVSQHAMSDGVIPYSVNSQLWSDGAYKARFIAIPDKEGEDRRIGYTGTGGWNFPNDTVIVKSFALERTAGDPASRHWIETRFMVRQQNEWAGYSYRWNDEGTDALLVDGDGADRDYEIIDPNAPSGVRKQTWHYPSRAECMVCHSRAANFVLGLQSLQMNRDHNYDGVVDNQLRTLEHLGLFRVDWSSESGPRCYNDYLEAARKEAGEKALDPEVEKELTQRTEEYMKHQFPARDQREASKTAKMLHRDPEHLPHLVDLLDTSASLELRARSYLHANCAHCHVPAGGGNAKLTLNFDTPLSKMLLVNENPLHHTFGLKNAKLVVPGSPERSVLLHRIAIRGAGQMPQLATSIVDSDAVKVIRDWIKSLPSKELSSR